MHGLLLLVLVLAFVAIPSRAADPPLFVKGQSYTVMVDCIPTWIAQGIANSLGANTFNPCFTEAGLIVVNVREDGWIEVTDPMSGKNWWLNTARMYAMQPTTVPQQAAQ